MTTQNNTRTGSPADSSSSTESDSSGAVSTWARGASAVDRYFHITERRSTIGTEVRAGVVTFFAMAYIVLLNPLDRKSVV